MWKRSVRRFIAKLRLRKRFGNAEWILIAAIAAVTLWLCFANKPTGWAVALLAALAFIMTILTPTRFQKGATIVIACVLFIIETHAIDRDHIDYENSMENIISADDALDQKTRTVLSTSASQTESILRQGATSLSKTTAQDQVLLDKSKRNLRLSSENLFNITGGSSFPFVFPMTDQNPQHIIKDRAIATSLWMRGNYPLTGITLTVLSLQRDMPLLQIQEGSMTKGAIGNPLPDLHPTAHVGNVETYDIRIHTQNGTYEELLEVRLRPDSYWETHWAVTTARFGADINSNIKRKLLICVG